MFHVGKQDGIAGQKFESQRRHVECMRGIERKNDFVFRCGIYKFGDHPAGAFNSFIRISLDAVVDFIRKPVPAPAAAASWILCVIFSECVDHRLGNEGGASAVQVNRRLPVTQLF